MENIKSCMRRVIVKENISKYKDKPILSSHLCFNLDGEIIDITQDREKIHIKTKKENTMKQAIQKLEKILT